MENYNQMVQENHHHHTSSSNNKNSRSNFSPYQDGGTPLGMTTTPSHHHHHHHHMNMNDSGGGSTGGGGGDYFQSALVAAAAAAAAGEDNSSNSIAKNERSQQATRFYNYPLLTSSGEQQQHLQFHQQVGGGRDQHVPSSRGRDCEMLGIVGSNNNGNRRSGNEDNNAGDQREVEVMKAKIIAHPQYPNLLQAYADCQKVGAPPDVAARLTVIRQEFETRQKVPSSSSPACSSKDPELDQFMEAYYDMLVKYREELTRPVQEAIEFMSRVEAQLHLLTDGRSRVFNSDEKSGANAGSSEEEPENSGGETELPEIDPRAEDRELKNHLLRKYSGYLSSLKQELSKKKKKGKLPKEARQKLLSWWELHYKWPYPSESEKVALAEATGLDQKQINNWFINQRKRHWKPSEDMQFMVMDGIHPQNAALYMEGHYLGDGPYRFGT